MIRRIEKPVRNNPGIYKEYKLDEETGEPIETGRYRALRRVKDGNGKSKKEQLMCGSLEEAKAFRRRFPEETPAPSLETETPLRKKGLTFSELAKEWQPFHYLKLERSTQQAYDKILPNLEYLFEFPVEGITTEVVDRLIQYWVKEHPKKRARENFNKELDLLKVILNHYRKRKNPAYVMPVFLEHYQAADIAKKAEQPVQALSQEELFGFLENLKGSKQKEYYPVALAQFCLGLRVGEVCGLHWDAVNLEKRVIKIEWTIVWDHLTWEPTVKVRPKNGKVRVLVVPEVLAEELKRLKAIRNPNVPFLFHRNGKPLNRQLVGKAYNLTLRKMGITDITGTHMLRKTAATLANEITGDFYAVSKLLDHSLPSVTLRYVSQTGVQKQKVAEALNSVLTRQKQLQQPNTSDGVSAKLGEIASPPAGVRNDALASPVPQNPDRRERPVLTLIKSIG